MAQEFASIARRARLEARVTLREVAETLRLSIAYVSEVERGNRPAPSPERAEQWALAVHGDPRAFRQAAMADMVAAELPIDDAPAYRRETALALARAFEDLTPEQAQQIQQILGGTE
jgi:transcriptional regulator with XRE-family HTH domain